MARQITPRVRRMGMMVCLKNNFCDRCWRRGAGALGRAYSVGARAGTMTASSSVPEYRSGSSSSAMIGVEAAIGAGGSGMGVGGVKRGLGLGVGTCGLGTGVGRGGRAGLTGARGAEAVGAGRGGVSGGGGTGLGAE